MIDKETELLLVKLYINKRKSLNEIKKITGKSFTSITGALKRNGYKCRNSSESSKIYNLDINYFNKINNHTKAQILGMIAADGCISEKKWSKCLVIGLKREDKYYLEFIKNQIKYTGPILDVYSKYNNKKFPSSKLSINDPKLVEDLKNLGIIPRKSLTLNFPTLEQVPEIYLNSFILGYFEGDGCISFQNIKCCNIPVFIIRICVTNQFGEKIKKILKDKLDINCQITLQNFYKKNNIDKNAYNLTISGTQQILKFLNWIYKDAEFVMKRKYERYLYLLETLKWRENNQEFLRNKMIENKKENSKPFNHSEEMKKKLSKIGYERETKSQTIFWMEKDNVFYKIRGIRRFCKDRQLSLTAIWNLIKGIRQNKVYKGWSICNIDESNIPSLYTELFY